jgi:catechol 2,3-dioxygenase-like lactoylglutathione lyase family enzyme
MLGDFDPVGFVHTVDVERAHAFYVEMLGLELVEQAPFALVVRSGRTTIRVTPVETHVPTPHTVLGWSVPDLNAALEDLTGRGLVTLSYEGLDQDERGVWKSPSGAKVAWFSDPDGNILSLTQS